MCQTALAGVRHLVMGIGAGVTGILDDVNQGRLVVFFSNGAFLYTVGQHALLCGRAQTETHGKTNALANDGTLQKNRLPQLAYLAGNNLIGELVNPAIVAAFISELCYLRKNPLAQICNPTVIISHFVSFLCK